MKEEMGRDLLKALQIAFYAIGAFVFVMFFTFQWLPLALIWSYVVDSIAHGNMSIGVPLFMAGIPLALFSAGFFAVRTVQFIEKIPRKKREV